MQTRTMVWESDSACSTNVLGIRVVGVFLSAMGIRQKKGRFGKAMAARALVTALQDTPEAWKMRKDPSLLGRGGGVS